MRLTAFFSQQEKVLEGLSEDGNISQEAANKYNMQLELELTAEMEAVTTVVIEIAKVQPGESVESARKKSEEAQGFMDYLGDLFGWVLEKLKSALRWCWEKAKQFFGYLKSFFV